MFYAYSYFIRVSVLRNMEILRPTFIKTESLCVGLFLIIYNVMIKRATH